MARFSFGGSLPDWGFTVATVGGAPVLVLAEGTLTFWDSHTGGNQYDDLLLGGDTVEEIDLVDGAIPIFSGPDNVAQLWVDGGGDRVLMLTTDLVARPSGGTDGQALLKSGSGAVWGDVASGGSGNTPAVMHAIKDTSTGHWPASWTDGVPDYTGGSDSAGTRPTADPNTMVIWKGWPPFPPTVTSGNEGVLDNVDVKLEHAEP